MEDLRINAAQSVTAVKPLARGSYEMVSSAASKIWHGGTHGSAEGGVNKGRNQTITYVTGADRNKIAEI